MFSKYFSFFIQWQNKVTLDTNSVQLFDSFHHQNEVILDTPVLFHDSFSFHHQNEVFLDTPYAQLYDIFCLGCSYFPVLLFLFCI